MVGLSSILTFFWACLYVLLGLGKAETTSQAHVKLGFQMQQGSPGPAQKKEEQGETRLRACGKFDSSLMYDVGDSSRAALG